ncbi:MAG: signal peptidase I [Candidatus Eisenbacteria bacterium]|nr:signal peptidase I [Candidatus Eisenbacteria bacterium]
MSSSAPRSNVRDYLEAIVWAVAITLVLRTFVIQAFRIPSESMTDTLLVGDFLFVNKLEYGAQVPFTKWRLPALSQPKRGDVIVFQFPEDPSEDYIKRCVATGGQTVKIVHKELFVDGVKQVEPYVKHDIWSEDPAGETPRDNYSPPTVPPGELFMMGDNRDNSNDSRYWGTVKRELVKGRALFVYFSTAGNSPWNSLFNLRWNRFFRVIK